jgi:PhnB protein
VRLNPYLHFNGQCEQAFAFYEKCLGAKIVMLMTYGNSPMAAQAPPGWQEKIVHATLTVGDQVLQGADALPNHYQKPQGFALSLNIQAAADADRIFSALAANGTVQLALQETFWALRFGMLVDQFGTPWMINCQP